MKEDFILTYAIKCNGITKENAKENYYSLLRAITAELRDKGSVVLPDLGKFYVKFRKEKKIRDVRGEMRILPRMRRLHFKPCKKLDAYISMADIKNVL